MAGRGDFLTIDRRKLDNLAAKGSATVVRNVTLRTAAIAQVIAPGSMKEKIRPIIAGTKSNPLGIVMVDHPAAHFVLDGTKPHDIFPVKKKALRFTIGNTVVYSKSVHHPGTKPNNFLLKAMLAARSV